MLKKYLNKFVPVKVIAFNDLAKVIPKVSIIIPHWNGIETLSECLDSIICSDFKSYEVIVSDNNSTDGSQDWIRKIIPM